MRLQFLRNLLIPALLLVMASISAAETTTSFSGMDMGLTYEFLSLTESDIEDTYGHISLFGLEAAVPIGINTSVILNGAYGQTNGNPFFDDPTFTGPADQTVKISPFSLGFRSNVSQNDRLRIYISAAFQATWIQEETIETSEGFGYGFIFGYGPEWRSQDDRLGISMLAQWRGGSGDLGRGYESHTFNTTGFSMRLGVTYSLGNQSGEIGHD
jgi:hypothetical protein